MCKAGRRPVPEGDERDRANLEQPDSGEAGGAPTMRCGRRPKKMRAASNARALNPLLATNMQKIVLDKSFLDGANGHQVREVIAQHQALIIEPLFYELMTTELPVRQRRAFDKLPREAGAFTLIPNMGTLLRFEYEHQQAVDTLDACAVEGKHIFNEGLRDGTYVPNEQVRSDIQQWETEVGVATDTFVRTCETVYHFFPALNGIELRDFPASIAAARRTVACDPQRVLAIYDEIRGWDAPESKLPSALLNEQWATFRFLQCHLLAALRIFGRYLGQLPQTAKFRLNAEHSMHDLEYVLSGSLVGAIATNDREVEEDFRLLRPDGRVIRPDAATDAPMSLAPPGGGR